MMAASVTDAPERLEHGHLLEHSDLIVPADH